MEKTLVIGGAGTVGRFIAGLLVDDGCRPIVIDRVAAERTFDQRVMDALALPTHAPELLQAAEVVVCALPEDTALQVLECYAGALPSLRLLVNTCSVQQPFHAQAARLFARVPVLGINPMFSPTLDCRGRPVALCERGQGERGQAEAGERYEALLRGRGMQVTRVTPDEHDRIMAACQTLPHAAILAFAFALQRSECDPRTFAALAPPPMQTMLSLVARILLNEPVTYWDIQKHNQASQRQREQLAGGLDALHQLCRQDSPAAFAAELQGVRDYLGPAVEHHGDACAAIFQLLNTPQGVTPHARSSQCAVDDHQGPREGSGAAGDHAARPAGDHR